MIIAIDPDIERSGYATMDGRNLIEAGSLPFHALCEYIHAHAEDKPLVVVEAGWLNASIWHNAYSQGARVTARISRNTGANQQVGKLIIEMAQHYGIDTLEQKPLRKRWSGKDGKITQEELNGLLKSYRITTPDKLRTNQDCRDAILIAIHHSL